ncbi:hypothetical protein [uncultured Bacteroides sp.]|uniref:hypothetical protein n=1 Tax=uncultured Bacteroides sp. TaxID=162156 RepID=UPI002601D683|nr:hypothetical protein [uncultured Bacteroides sp.]
MTNISTFQELEHALQSHAMNILIKDEELGKAVILAGRIQSETLSSTILKHITGKTSFKIALGNGITIQVKKDLADNALETLNLFDTYKTEIDVEDIKTRKVNLYYNS